MSLHVEIHGAEQNPTVVFLHAIATSGQMWRPQIEQLASSFRVVTVDLPGHGRSPMPSPGDDLGTYASAVVESLAAQNITSFSLVGLSLGGMVAVRIAAEYPAVVSNVVLACCGARTSSEAAEVWRERIERVHESGMTSEVEPTIERWFTPRFIADEPATIDWVHDMIRHTPAGGFTAAASAISSMDHTSLLTRITAPTLVISGKQDTAVPAAATSLLSAGISGARGDVLDAAHLASVEAPVDFGDAVRRFVTST